MLVVVVAAAGVIALVAFFNAHDNSTTSGTSSVQTHTITTGELAAGNVVLEYSQPGFEKPLRRLAAEQSGSAQADAALVQSGQAVIVRRKAGTAGVRALAQGHQLVVNVPTDPALTDFISQYLGGS